MTSMYQHTTRVKGHAGTFARSKGLDTMDFGGMDANGTDPKFVSDDFLISQYSVSAQHYSNGCNQYTVYVFICDFTFILFHLYTHAGLRFDTPFIK